MREYGNAVRINRDLLRTMLHCDAWSGKKEGATRHAARVLAIEMLREVGVVIIDDTNLNIGVVQSWKQLARMRKPTLRSSASTLHSKNACARCSAGKASRTSCDSRYGDAIWPLSQATKVLCLCDIDGTLADLSHRRHFVQQEPKDWGGFFAAMDKDDVRVEIREQVAAFMRQGYEIIFVSGRPDTYRKPPNSGCLVAVPFQQGNMPPTPLALCHLFMRRAEGHRPDTDVKADILRTYWPDRSWIH